MLLSLWPNWWDDWSSQWKCTFDGVSKTITINPSYDEVSVKNDIYGGWKEWVKLRDNTKFAPALRVIGGDPVGSGLSAGDIYFLTNGWQVVVDHLVRVQGVLYHDDAIDAYLVMEGGGVISSVSNLVQSVSTSGGSSVDYNRIEDIVRDELNANATMSEIQSSIQEIIDKIDTLAAGTDLSEILDGVNTLEAKIKETQAFVLSI